jgi:signal transduction histidine kinase/ligand-binding sensor domain-containing protein/DNA-binding response OmpR family regulator
MAVLLLLLACWKKNVILEEDMTFWRSTLIFVFIIQFAFNKVNAQNRTVSFTHLSKKDGLSSTTVAALTKDHFGFLWIGTEDGLNRYDGTDIKTFRHSADNRFSLPSNRITSVLEDNNGYIWVGTDGGGVCVYDRKKDTFFNFIDSPGGRTMNVSVTALCEDDDAIWVATYDGVYVITKKSRKVTHIYLDSPILTETRAVSCLVRDNQKNIWAGTHGGLFKFNRHNKKFIRYQHTQDLQSLSDDFVMTIAEDKNLHYLWIGTRNGLNQLNSDGKTFTNYFHPNRRANIIHAISAENENKLWLGTEEGINIFDVKKGAVTEELKPDKRDQSSLSGRTIRSILMDSAGIYWVGTFQEGLNKYDKNQIHFSLKESDPFDKNGLTAPIVTSFADDNQNGVFVGTDGGGISLFHPSSKSFEKCNILSGRKESSKNLAVLALEMGQDNTLWIGTYIDGLFAFNPATKHYQQYLAGPKSTDLNVNDIFCLKADSRNDIWMGTNEGITIFHPSTKLFEKISMGKSYNLPSNVIRAIEEDQTGQMWIGTHGGGIAVWNSTKRLFTVFDRGNSNIPSNYVVSILKDKKGNIWIGTENGGLSLYDAKHRRFTSFGEKQGLKNDGIKKLLEDDRGRIWLSTNLGISYFDPLTKTFTNFSYYNGLQSGEFTAGSGIRLGNGQLYFGGQDGFNYFHPSELNHVTIIPKIVFLDLKIDNQVIQPNEKGPIKDLLLFAKEIKLPYQKNFSISFSAINYSNPQQNRIQYRMKGMDKEWITAGKDYTAYYTNLSPGEYLFEVRASTQDGFKNADQKAIKIIITPPFWLTVPAFIFYLLSIGLGLMYIRLKGIKKLKQAFALQQERAAAQQLLNQERDKATHMREIDHLKIKFLTNLSHEFRTPISLIIGPIDNLLAKVTEPDLNEQLGLIKRNGRRLLNLVNQLLDFRKMEEQQLKLNATHGELIDFLKDVADSFTDLANRRKISYTFHTDVQHAHVLFDENKLERILFNLLSNAFKFTPEGGQIQVNVTCSDEKSIDKHTWFNISVTDNGIGIPANVKDQIFENFFQWNNTNAVFNHGSGIGLAIAREFVRLHEGEITVESEPGKGSCFMITIPFVPAEIEVTEIYVEREDETEETVIQNDVSITEKNSNNTGKPILLLVEDDNDFRFYLKENLKVAYAVIEATDGKEGWRRALADHPDIIVSDVQMPFVTGVELSKKIKSDKRTAHIPIILLTASGGEAEQILGLQSGATDYLTKPFNFAVLYVKISNLLTLNRNFKETYSKHIKIDSPVFELESESHKLMTKIRLYLEENIGNTQLSVDSLSEIAGMSRVSLYKRMLAATGMTPVEYIRTFRLERATLLMEKSDLNIAQIAYQVGFSTPAYFSKAFKDKYGMVPSNYIVQKRNPTDHYVAC